VDTRRAIRRNVLIHDPYGDTSMRLPSSLRRQAAPTPLHRTTRQLCGMVLGLSLAIIGLPAPAQTAEYPDKPIRIVIPFAAGGPTDVAGRMMAEDMSKTLGQAVVVENRPGGNGVIATRYVAKAAPDGYTLLFTSLNHTVNPHLLKAPGYDPSRDFAPISLVTSSPSILIVGAVQPYKSMQELVAAGKARDSRVTFGSAGHGGSAHLAGELLKKQSGAQFLHVPFKGNGPAATDLMGGQITFMFYPTSGIKSLLESGKVRPLAITSAQRSPAYPNIPTMKEQGLEGFENAHSWLGLLAPAGTSAAIVNKLHDAVRKSADAGRLKEQILSSGSSFIVNTPSEFGQYIVQDLLRWKAVIESAGIQPE
jgi:tripartite-type tricarboxylate transporter receptor subunit TctC